MSLVQEAERHPVTTILCVGAIAAFIAGETGRSLDHLVLTPLDAFTAPWRYVTTIFPHGGIIHIVFNLLWTWQLGQAIEARVGSAKMVGLALLLAVAASATELLFLNTPIGLSGLVYGFATFAWARGRHDARFREVIDKRTIQFLGGWFLLCIVATETGMMRIANGAHAGGAAMGYLMGMRRPWFAPAFLAALAAGIVLRIGREGASVPPLVIHRRAEAAIGAEKYEQAIELYEQLFANGERTGGALFNYGLSLYRVGRREEGMNALIDSYELKPEIVIDPDLRQAIIEAKAIRDGAK